MPSIPFPFIADLHIHSLYSRATSKASNLHGLAAWAAIKGIDLIATGDFTHPGWFAHLVDNLEPAEPGLFRLKKQPDFAELASILPPGVQPDCSKIRFLLSAEISSIYKRGGKVRKIHNLLYVPDLEAARRINTVLAGIGNLHSDGRPILGLDSRILLEILLEQAPEGFLVPAHIWTPWFSLFGSKSGFNAIEECFDDLSSEIFALETGLSSDPVMNRYISALDRFSLISNSDCHSPSKLGREANIFATERSFPGLKEAMRNPVDASGEQRFQATVEFYPEEGKYHCDGHRKCGVCLEPAQTVEAEGICPECGRPMTIGVLYRVMELADRKKPVWPKGSPAVHSLIPLQEMLGELFNCGPATKKVNTVYGKLINSFGSEFGILLETPVEELNTASPLLGTAIQRVRENKVIRKPGFDGEFGVIRVFEEEERDQLAGQLNLFGMTPAKARKKSPVKKVIRWKKSQVRPMQAKRELNLEQQAAVDSLAPRIIVQAGLGTGKTHTLVQRMNRLLGSGQQAITVITFTNKAANELQQRLALLDPKKCGEKSKDSGPPCVRVDTFHGFCVHWLCSHDPALQLAGPEMRTWIFRKQYPQLSEQERRKLRREAGLFLAEQRMLPEPIACPETLRPYFAYLREHSLLDLDEIVPACTTLLHNDKNFSEELRAATVHLLVDEFQDLNAAQYELVRLLAETATVFAIGDPDQAIYGFRGSRPAWFQHFITEQEPEFHQLAINYRSGADILQAAGAVITANHVDEEQETRTTAVSEHPGTIFRYLAPHAKAEANFIAGQIQQLIGGTSHREIDQILGNEGGLALSEIAVLYRTARQAETIAQALAERTIPCQVVDVQPFYQRRESKQLYYWILLSTDHIDAAELLFLLAQEKGIGAKGITAAEAVLSAEKKGAPLDTLAANAADLPKNLQKRIAAFQELASQMIQQKTAAKAVNLLCEEFQLNRDDPDLVRFCQMAASASSLSAFADHLRKHQDNLIYDGRAESVLLATLHAAKGLEFRAVFMVGCENGLLPLTSRSELSKEAELEHIQEERRLFFVGMTRAAEVLYLTGAKERLGFSGLEQRTPSPFLSEIPPELLQNPLILQKQRKKKRTGKQLSLF
ncbi:UvrD-helicase domain-containing protein [Candidatus Electrothrix sp.]|uniref:UvrD-helicase domain-containing protein n=1 Tax=Candidatus Electrothrix sp. TaxID=2170559 RepID=UPI0040574A09